MVKVEVAVTPMSGIDTFFLGVRKYLISAFCSADAIVVEVDKEAVSKCRACKLHCLSFSVLRSSSTTTGYFLIGQHKGQMSEGSEQAFLCHSGRLIGIKIP